METKTHNHIKIGRNLELYVPKNLAACDAYEYSAVCGLMFNWQTGLINFEEFRVQAIYKLLKLKKPKKRKLNKLEEEIMFANVYELSNLIDSFFQKSGDDLMMDLDFVHNHNPKVKTLFSHYYGPADRFEDVSWGQYEDALNIYNLYNQTKDVKFIYILFATFYLRKGKPYDKKSVEKVSKVFKYVDFGTVYGFYLFFAAFQIYLTSTIIMYEGKLIDLSILFKEIKEDKFKSDIPGLGVKSLSYHLAETNVFGDLDKVRNQDMWEVFLRLYDLRKRDIDALKRQEELERKGK